MPTREQVLTALRTTDDDYRRAGDLLGVPPGQAYLTATGLPADGGDTFPPQELDQRPGVLETSTQFLVTHHSPPENPTAKPHVHEWIKRMAAGDQQMRHAAQARDAAPGEVEEPEETDICTVLTRDHDQVTALIEQLQTIPGVTAGGSAVHQSRRKSIADMITVALSQHEATEQELFWPIVRKKFQDGDQVVGQALAQEQQGKDLLQALGETPASDERFDELATELKKAASRHVAFEDVVLLALRRDMDLEERRQLGARFRSAEGRAPTRPHPHAPKEPAGAVKVAGATAAAMDKVRDTVGDRPAERRGKAEQETEEQTEE